MESANGISVTYELGADAAEVEVAGVPIFEDYDCPISILISPDEVRRYSQAALILTTEQFCIFCHEEQKVVAEVPIGRAQNAKQSAIRKLFSVKDPVTEITFKGEPGEVTSMSVGSDNDTADSQLFAAVVEGFFTWAKADSTAPPALKELAEAIDQDLQAMDRVIHEGRDGSRQFISCELNSV